MWIRLGLLVSAVLLSFGCNYTRDKTVPVTGPVSFSLIREAISDRCVACHGGGKSWDCTVYGDVLARLEKVRDRVLVKKDMPPGSPLSQWQQDLLARWIAAGAPEFGEAPPVPPPKPKPLEPRFSSIHEKILSNMCVHCHSPGKPGANVPLNTLKDLVDSPRLLVIPGNADESGLYLVVRAKAKPSKKMPPPDSGIRPLSPEEVSIIVDWINAGAPE